MMTARSLSATGSLLVVTALLTGCAEEPSLAQPAPNQANEPPAATITPKPSVAELQEPAIPTSCDEILPPDVVQSYDSRLTLTAEEQQAGASLVDLLGPATVATLQTGTDQVYCGWGIANTGAFAYLGIASISEQHREELLAAFRGSVYEEADSSDAVARFIRSMSSEHKYVDDIVIDENLLVAVAHSIEGNFAVDAFAQITSATGAPEQ